MADIDELINSDENKCNQNFQLIYEKLIKCGFSSQRCLQGIAATGISTEGRAAYWLAAHMDDPDLDNPGLGRDFCIFLCPPPALHRAVLEFWELARTHTGSWALAFDYPPHVTIVPQFQIPISQLLSLHSLLTAWLAKHCRSFSSYGSSNSAGASILESLATSDSLDTKKNFLGFQVVGTAKTFLEQLSNQLLKELDSMDIVMDESVRKSRKGIFHLSLAYGFPQPHAALLSQLVPLAGLGPDVVGDACSLADWRLCLYSSDRRMRSVEEMYYMNMDSSQSPLVTATVTTTADSGMLRYRRLELVGSVPPGAAAAAMTEQSVRLGAATGVNMCSGTSGFFVPEHGCRVPQSEAWTLHLRTPLLPSSQSSPNPAGEAGTSGSWPTVPSLSSLSLHSSASCGKPVRRRVIVMRHGERVDFCFRNWINKCFDNKGIYRRHNLNMPVTLPNRKPDHFFHDSPLTVLGCRVAYDTGCAMRCAGIRLTRCYSSPALRCVQTASECLRGFQQTELGIRVEPLLFEWMGWYRSQSPVFLGASSLVRAGLPVLEREYGVLSRLADLRPDETPTQYYERKGKLARRIVETGSSSKRGSQQPVPVLLIVGHAASLDVCSRPLLIAGAAHTSISDKEFHARAAAVPFCGLLQLEERSSQWHICEPPVPSFSHTKSAEFNWREIFRP